MAINTFTATEQRAAQNLVIGKGESGNVKNLTSTIEFTASDTASTVDFGEIPSGARILSSSRVYCDDCATTGAPIMDFGLSSGDITNDPDAIGNGLVTLATASTIGYPLISDVANGGVKAYTLVSGQTEDPKNPLTVYGSLTDAATDQTGTITLDLYYILD